jgi:hypothetical protein
MRGQVGEDKVQGKPGPVDVLHPWSDYDCASFDSHASQEHHVPQHRRIQGSEQDVACLLEHRRIDIRKE